jgi:hypothetical protein
MHNPLAVLASIMLGLCTAVIAHHFIRPDKPRINVTVEQSVRKPDGPPWTVMHDGAGHYTFTDQNGERYQHSFVSKDVAQHWMTEWRKAGEEVENHRTRKYTPVTE